MAKRKRLIPAPLAPGFDPNMAEKAPTAAPETKSLLRHGLGTEPRVGLSDSPPPIAQVAADASARAALAELSEAMARARAEGRLVQALPLGTVDPTHLVRDRIGLDEEELGHLIASIRDHGQRTPIEVTELPDGRFGLISGWRRLQALKRLSEETGEERFATVLALLRRPEGASDAYVAMVEENEVRQGLSYYERARIAARAVELGVFETEKLALQRLFAAASRARRSKIGSFLGIYHHLDDVLRFPAAIPERLGLTLAKVLDEGDDRRAALIADLQAKPAADALEEQARLLRFVAAPTAARGAARSEASTAAPAVPAQAAHERTPVAETPAAEKPAGRELAPGVFLEVTGGWLHPVLTLSGPAVGPDFREKLEKWLIGS